MRFIALLLLLASMAAHAAERKSADECEAELISKYGSKDQKRMMDCLLEGDASYIPPEKKPEFTHYIDEFGINEVNSAGGVEPYARIVNPNKKTPIKYVRLSMTAYNGVGDAIRSTIGGHTTASMRYTGPLSHEQGEGYGGWEPAWYNATAKCLKLQSVHVEFMDGKTLAFAGPSLAKALKPGLSNDCSYKR